MRLTTKLIMLSGIALLLASCRKDIEDLTNKINKTKGAVWNSEIALPLINTTLKLDDIITQTDVAYVKKDAENVVVIAYRGELLSQMASDFVIIDNQSFIKDYTLTSAQQNYFNTNGNITLQFTDYMDYVINDVEIDSMILKVCSNQLRIQSSFKHYIEFTYTFPEVTRNGVPFSITFNGNYTGNPVDVAQNVNLAGYKFLMSSGPKGHSQIKVEMEMKLTKVGGNNVDGTEKVTASLFMFYNDYKILYGYIGQRNFLVETDSLKLDALDKIKGGNFTLDDPRFKLIVSNSLGVPVRADVVALKGYSSTSGSINLTGVPNPLPIPVPNNNQVGQTVKDSIVLNKNTSNIATLINSRPSYFIYGFDVTSNPAGSTVRNFIVDTSRITIEVDVEIPLIGSATNITLEQDQDISIDLGSEADFLDKVLLRMVVDNGFPLGVDLQVYLLDSNKIVLDSVLTTSTGFIPAAPVNFTTGRVTSSARNLVDIIFEKSRINHLKDTKSIRIRGVLNTTKNNGAPDPVKIYADYGLGVKFGVQARIKFNQDF